MTTARDTYNQLVYAEEKGREEGEREKTVSIARKMKDLGLASDIISASTGLDEEAIKNLH